jgi:AhpD family alkylhydroperoxidase
MVGLQRAVDAAGIEPLLLELVKMRASQINGCAYCLDMHSKDARALGESEQRLHARRRAHTSHRTTPHRTLPRQPAGWGRRNTLTTTKVNHAHSTT